jgi:hypothetical protein
MEIARFMNIDLGLERLLLWHLLHRHHGVVRAVLLFLLLLVAALFSILVVLDRLFRLTVMHVGNMYYYYYY